MSLVYFSYSFFCFLFNKFNITFQLNDFDVGGLAIDNHGVALPASTLKGCEDSNAILFGSIGGPKWDNLDFSKLT